MITVAVVVAVLVALFLIIGGACIALDADSGFLARMYGYNAICTGWNILASIVPELIAAAKSE